MRALLLAVLLALAVAAPARRAGAGAEEAAPIPVIGIGEQNPEMFASPYFRALERQARARHHGLGLAAPPLVARRAGPLHVRRARRRREGAARLRPRAQHEAQGAPPRAERARVHQGVPEVQEALPVAEGVADLERGQPLRRADLPQGRAASPASSTTSGTTASAARSSPPTCSTRPTMPRVGARVPPHRPRRQGHLGPAQLHRRQPLPHHGHEGAAEGGPEGQDLVHGDRRAGRAPQRLADRLPRQPQARGEGDQAGVQARRAEPARAARLHLPLDAAAREAADVGLRARRPARQAAPRLQGAEDASSASSRARPPPGAASGRADPAPTPTPSPSPEPRRRPRREARGRDRGRAAGRGRRLAGCGAALRGDQPRRPGRRHHAERLLAAARAGQGRRARHGRRREARALRGARDGGPVRDQLPLDRRGRARAGATARASRPSRCATRSPTRR